MISRRRIRGRNGNEPCHFPAQYGMFRVNIFRQKSFVGIVIRQIKLTIKTIDDWGLPAVMKDICMSKRALSWSWGNRQRKVNHARRAH